MLYVDYIVNLEDVNCKIALNVNFYSWDNFLLLSNFWIQAAIAQLFKSFPHKLGHFGTVSVMSIIIHQDQLNTLVYKYLLEAGSQFSNYSKSTMT